MTENTNTELMDDFFENIAKKWQDYIPYNFIEGINLSLDQKKVIDLFEDQLMVMGCAGSGKSITLLYKMIRTMIAETEPKRMLYVSYNQSLIDDAKKRARRSEEFKSLEARHHVEIKTFHYMVYDLLKMMKENVKPIFMSYEKMEKNTDDAVGRVYSAMVPYITPGELRYEGLASKERLFKTHTASFVRDEIFWMKANGFVEREDYINATRNGRGSIPRLEKNQRNTIFDIFLKYQDDMKYKYHDDMDLEDYALRLLQKGTCIPESLKYDYVFVDEVQDLQPMQVKALVAITKGKLVISGDNKQRIYKTTNHTYEALGLGRLKRRTLVENYRSTKQIMSLAHKIRFDDVEQDKEKLIKYVRDGKEPIIKHFAKAKDYMNYIVDRIKSIHEQDPKATVAVIVRNDDQVKRGEYNPIQEALKRSFLTIDIVKYGAKYSYDKKEKQIVVTDPYSVKGLEFDYVIITDFDKFHYPLRSKFEELDKAHGEQSQDNENYLRDRENIINNEKRILYVAMTRAKKELDLVYCTFSEGARCTFLDD